MKRLLSLIISLCAMALTFASASAGVSAEDGGSYVATVYNERNGLPTGEANDVIQTSDGYIWICSYGGLIRYDGTVFRNYSTEGAIPSSSIRALFEDSLHRLWVGTNDAGVFVMENGAFKKPDGQPSDSFLCIRSFAESADGTIYASSSSGLAEIKDGVMSIVSAPELDGQTVYCTASDKFGRIWCSTSGGGVTVVSGGKVVGAFADSELFDEGIGVYCVTSGSEGSVWIGTTGTVLARLTFPGESLDKEDIGVSYYDTGNVATHNSIRLMPDGGLAVNALRGFGVLYPDGRFLEFGEDDHAVSVNSSYIDYEGNIWLASTSGGIVKYTMGCFTSPNRTAGLTDIAINAVAISEAGGSGSGVYYIGTDSGIIICSEDWQRVENNLTAMLEGVRVRDIITDSKGRVWIASYSDYPVICFDPADNYAETFSETEGLASNRARVLTELSDGTIAVGTQSGVSYISPDGKVTESVTDFEYPSVLCMLETDDGALLIGSDGGGIYELREGEVIPHGFSEGLGEGVVLRMLRDGDSGGYFISAGSSLYYWKDNAFTKLTALEKGPGSIFDFYLIDGKLWLLQNNGILCADREDLLNGGSGSVVDYSFNHGLTGSLNANTWHWLTDDGRLYLATRSGISVFGFARPEYRLPAGAVKSVTVDGTQLDHPEKVELSNTANRMTVDFAALSYTDTTRLSIAYKLDGFDAGETVLDNVKSGNISYTNLPGGEYAFKMRIFLTDDPDTFCEYSVEIVKEKRLTEQPLFWVVAAALALGLAIAAFALIYYLKMRTIKRRQREYRQIIDQALKTFAGTIDAKDKYTNGHSYRVARYSRELAARMGMSEDEQENIFYVALLHDIGKIGIPDNILNKPGKLDEKEREVIQQHPRIGAEILKNFTALEGIADGARYHHERYDGKGYCEHLSGKDIPLMARIIGVADTFDAMSSRRCYRAPLSEEVIVSELEKGKGTQFDPEIVPFMLDMIKDGSAPIMQDSDNTPRTDR